MVIKNPLKIWHTIRVTFKIFGENNCATLAAALSYYTIFSIAPLLVIVISFVGTLFGRDAVEGRIYSQIEHLVGHQGALAVEGFIQNIYEPANTLIATVIGLITLFFGATGVFTQLKHSLNTIWNIEPKPKREYVKFILDRLLSFAYILGIGFILIVTLVISTLVNVLSEFLADLLGAYSSYFLKMINISISLVILTLLFSGMFKILTDSISRWKDVLIGGIFTAILFSVGELLIGFYLGKSNFASTYGAAGSIIIIMVWVNYSSFILFLGAAFTYVFAKNYGKPIRPNKFSIHLRPVNDPKISTSPEKRIWKHKVR
ncbi:MAG TPA: YihY/virulence factor BrkB family protein [Cytophagales bacterium]|nr:YihY/virulence factor BrkB family protein [Cytophagales bacterium]